MLKRRSRMQRTRTGKSLALTARDLEIFRTLRRYRFLRSTYLYAFAGGESEKRFKERLGDLFHEGYLDRPAEQWRFADARFTPVVHELGKGTAEAAPDAEPVTWLCAGPHRQFQHSLMTCEVLASIELACRDRDDIRFISWPEILAKAPEATKQSAKPFVLAADSEVVVPDALFGLEYRREGRKAFRFFALEADRGTMPIARASKQGTSLLGKLVTYQKVLANEVYRARLGIPNLLILTLTAGASRGIELVKRFGEAAGEAPQFLFQAIAGASALAHPEPALLLGPWQRPRLAPIWIDR
jgi:hypothetical protein